MFLEIADSRFELDLSALSIQRDAITLQWSPLNDDVIGDVDSINIYWSFHDDERDESNVCVDVSAVVHTLDGLYPNTIYSIGLGVNLKTGATVFSKRVYFVTSKGESETVNNIDKNKLTEY